MWLGLRSVPLLQASQAEAARYFLYGLFEIKGQLGLTTARVWKLTVPYQAEVAP